MLKKKLKSTKHLTLGFIIGFGLILLLSTIQKLILGIDLFDVKGYIAPMILGGIGGVFVTYFQQKSRAQNQKLKESEFKFQTLINLSLDGIYVENERGEILDCNTMGHEMFGYTKEEMLRLSIKDLVPPQFASFLPDIITEDMATGDVYLERENIKKDGTLFPTEINTKFVQLNGERRLIAYVRDITERKRIEQALIKNEAALKEVIATKDKIFSIIAHDLKGSFNSIMGFSELLEELAAEQHDQKIRNYSELINSSVTQSYNLLENLLDWAMIHKKKLKIKPEYLNLNHLTSEVSVQIAERVQSKDIKLEIDVPESLPITADKNMLKTVLRNLLANAIKFSFPGGQIKVQAKIDNENRTIRISIQDYGIGMPPEIQKNLFDLTTNHSQLGTNNEKGTGIGLIICKEFIEKHHGKIGMESEEGNGSTFYIELPAIR